jgi:hypothetical protein
MQVFACMSIAADLRHTHEWVMADLHRGVQSTLNIVSNEIKCIVTQIHQRTR